MLFRAVLAVAVLAVGGYLIYEWQDRLPRERVTSSNATDPQPPDRVPLTRFPDRVGAWRPDLDTTTALLGGGVFLLLMSVSGRFIGPWLWLRRSTDEPRHERGGHVEKITRPDGTVLHVEVYGPPDGMPIVLTHGWGGDGTEWYDVKRTLGTRYRLIVWDLPGLGLSTAPHNNDYCLEKMAGDLDAVIQLAQRPVVLLGHSIGGMTMLTFAREFSTTLKARVAGMVLVHTTPVNPVFTKVPTWLLPVIQKPLLEPLCWVTIGLSPLLRAMAWLSYWNGSTHRSNHRSLFAGTETWGQLDFVTRYTLKASPAVLARGTLGMFRYDASQNLGRIDVPVLVVGAAGDKTTIPEASERMAREIPGAELATLAPARHMGLLERNEEFVQLVSAFCLKRERESAAVQQA